MDFLHFIFHLSSLPERTTTKMEYYTLANGVKMPAIGFGTFQIPPDQTEAVVLDAIKVGYRCIDTAAAYMNEEGVGNAIKKCGVPRKDLFIITKLWVQDHGYEETKKAIETSLKKLQLDYVDLYLIHQPFGDYYGSWRAMEEYLEKGKLRAIGLANFHADRFVDLALHNKVAPMVDQIEIHPFHQRDYELKTMHEFKVQPQGWAPFAEGKNGIFHNEILSKIGKAHNKSVAQVILRWNVQRGVQVIPKSVKKERMAENFNIFDFKLTDEEMKEISTLDKHESLFLDHRTAESAKNFAAWKIH